MGYVNFHTTVYSETSIPLQSYIAENLSFLLSKSAKFSWTPQHVSSKCYWYTVTFVKKKNLSKVSEFLEK